MNDFLLLMIEPATFGTGTGDSAATPFAAKQTHALPPAVAMAYVSVLKARGAAQRGRLERVGAGPIAAQAASTATPPWSAATMSRPAPAALRRARIASSPRTRASASR